MRPQSLPPRPHFVGVFFVPMVWSMMLADLCTYEVPNFFAELYGLINDAYQFGWRTMVS